MLARLQALGAAVRERAHAEVSAEPSDPASTLREPPVLTLVAARRA